MRKWLKPIFFTLLLSLGLLFTATPVASEECNDSACWEQKISEYQKELARLSSQADTLSNQIAQFNAQIRLTEAKINQTEEKILLLGGRIDQLELSLGSLTDAFSSRAVETYKMTRFGDSLFFVFSGGDLSEVVSRFKYLQKIQEADRGLLVRLQKAQNAYHAEKTDQEQLQGELEDQTKVLGAQKEAKNQLLAVTKSDETKYQQLLKDAQAQLAAFRRFVTLRGGASILSNQTKCDGWGCYYNQRDSQWGNIAINNSDSSMAEYGCLITSMAMVASHYGKSIKPSDIATTSNVFFGNTAYMIQGTWTAAGVTTTRTRVCAWCGETVVKQKIDEELNLGRPVVAGLYGGPDHFIVIVRKEGENYIMYDPFMPDGGNRPLTDQYKVSDISTVDVVRVN